MYAPKECLFLLGENWGWLVGWSVGQFVPSVMGQSECMNVVQIIRFLSCNLCFFFVYLYRKNKRNTMHLKFPSAKSIVVSGDIHGDFNQLIFKLCVQYQLRDTLLIVAGDCGFGFENPGYYEDMAKRNSKRMSEANNWIVFVRGNHDNPAYFDGRTFKHRRLMAVPDYSVIQACGQ